MKALVCRETTGIDQLVYTDVESPALKPGSVRVRMRAAAVNFPDVLMAEDKYQFKAPLPFVVGMEGAGEILEVADGVRGLAPRDRVAVVPGIGCFADEAVVDADYTFSLPAEMDFETAAGFVVTYGTAYHALVDRGGINPGETLLVHGAAGGVGLAAVEVGKALGARVIAAAGTNEKLALCREHGADHAFNYRDEPIRESVRALTDNKGADVIFDPVGGDVTLASLRCINRDGRLLIIGFAGGEIARLPANLVLLKRCQVVGVAYRQFSRDEPGVNRQNMEALFGMWRQGQLRPYVSERFGLADGADALRVLQDRRAHGKVVVTMG